MPVVLKYGYFDLLEPSVPAQACNGIALSLPPFLLFYLSGPHDGLIQSETCSHEKILILIYLLTAIGLTPGGSSTIHIYAQTIHTRRTTQLTTLVGRLSGFRTQSGQTKINDELTGKNYRLMGRMRAVFD